MAKLPFTKTPACCVFVAIVTMIAYPPVTGTKGGLIDE